METYGDNEGLLETKNLLSNTDIVGACAKEWAKTKCKSYKLTNVTVFRFYSEQFTRCVKTQHCQSHLRMTILLIVQSAKTIR